MKPKTVKDTSSINNKNASSPLHQSAQSQIGLSQNESKFKNNPFGAEAPPVGKERKSRNKDIGGMTPSEQALFNSNREKSPVLGQDTTASTSSKSPRIQSSRVKPLVPSTGETGGDGGNDQEKQSESTKMSQAQLQKSLPNKYGEFVRSRDTRS